MQMFLKVFLKINQTNSKDTNKTDCFSGGISMADYTVYIDGMSSVEGFAGIGIVMIDHAKGTVREYSESCHTGSNTRGELTRRLLT